MADNHAAPCLEPVGTALHGWLVIDKPVGPGSTEIVSAVKRALKSGHYPKLKVGHGGTLDPLASGVLPIAIGEATKVCGYMLNADKIYDFTVSFGAETNTLDAEGAVIATSEIRPAAADIEAILPRFTGVIEQTPPAFSALKIRGKPAYARARAGEELEMKARTITIFSLVLVSTQANEATFTARVSKGTYIRSLARDIAHALKTVGHVTMLRRTKTGPFTLEQAISLDKLANLAMARQLEQILLPLAAGLDDIPALSVTPDQARLLRQGQKLTGITAQPGLYLATDQSVPVALVELMAGKISPELRVVRGFNP